MMPKLLIVINDRTQAPLPHGCADTFFHAQGQMTGILHLNIERCQTGEEVAAVLAENRIQPTCAAFSVGIILTNSAVVAASCQEMGFKVEFGRNSI